MKILGNILWLLLGGLPIAFGYAVSGLGLCITIIGIPFGIQAFKLAALSLLPFGRVIGERESAHGCVAVAFNLIWLLTSGIAIALTHLLLAALCAVTIIGIPFARQHIKLVSLALTPFGREIH